MERFPEFCAAKKPASMLRIKNYLCTFAANGKTSAVRWQKEWLPSFVLAAPAFPLLDRFNINL